MNYTISYDPPNSTHSKLIAFIRNSPTTVEVDELIGEGML